MTSSRRLRPARIVGFAWLALGALLAAVPLRTAGRLPAAERAAAEDGFKAIWNGENLDGWDGDPRFWRVDGGAIVGQTTAERPTQGNTFLIWRDGLVDDFELRLEYRLTGGNSGIQVRSFENPAEWGKWVVGGYQADMEAGDRFTGIIYGERYRGILADRGQKTVIGDDHTPKVDGSVGDPKAVAAAEKKGDWNEYRIEARGKRIRLVLNGVATAETVDEDREMARRSGLLALQLHAGPPMKIEFRNIRLKRLPLGDLKKIVLIAGTDSHGAGEHAHGDGMSLLAEHLDKSGLPVLAAVYRHGGWPRDPSALDNADAIAMYSDGGDGHMVLGHLDEVDRAAKRGAGVACIHYAVEVPKEKAGRQLLEWTGGYFEQWLSVNPFWKAEFKKLPDHPVARGVKPFTMEDEWYFHMRFPEGMKGVTSILEAVPPEEVRNRPDGPHSGNPHVRARKGMAEVVAWTYERPGGGRGFGTTGGHFHRSWQEENFRRVVLNALVWIAGLDVPPEGLR